MSWVITIAGIMALIVLHELGHFAVAKAVGMRVERFSLFFPPKLVGVRRGETEYMIGAIPAGGYVKITGMSPEEIESLPPEVARRAYYNQAPWKRVAVILAGPGMNLLIAFVLFWAVLFSGSLSGAETLSELNPSVKIVEPTTSVIEVQRGEPADGALEPGDRIVAVEGRPATVSTVTATIGSHRCPGALTNGCRASTPVSLTVRRHGALRTISVYPRYDAQLDRMLVGFDFGVAAQRLGPFAAARTTVEEMWGSSVSLVTNIGKAFTSEKVRHQLHSIVGITTLAQESVVAGPGYALVFIGFISLVLAVVNLFPFLPLDGGHVLWAVAEKLRGRRISVQAMWRYSSVGIVLLLFLVVNGFSNDISRLGG